MLGIINARHVYKHYYEKKQKNKRQDRPQTVTAKQFCHSIFHCLPHP
jgi:hypothetical protein